MAKLDLTRSLADALGSGQAVLYSTPRTTPCANSCVQRWKGVKGQRQRSVPYTVALMTCSPDDGVHRGQVTERYPALSGVTKAERP